MVIARLNDHFVNFIMMYDMIVLIIQSMYVHKSIRDYGYISMVCYMNYIQDKFPTTKNLVAPIIIIVLDEGVAFLAFVFWTWKQRRRWH